MKKKYIILLFMFVAVNVFAQTYDVTINVTDAVAMSNIENADVTFDATTLQTDVDGNVTFSGFADGNYTYSISADCYGTTSGSIDVIGANVNESYDLTPLTTANVFWNVNQDNSPMSFPVATAEISMTDGVNTYTKTYSEFDNIMTGVAFGTYNYTISTDCHADRTGSVTVGCATIDAMSGNVAVWEVQGDAQTMAPIFWNINQDNSPMSFPVATAEISMTDGVNTYTKTYSEFDNIMTDVAFGTYDYTITTETCRVRAGSVTVGCGTIDAMSGNVAVWEVQGDASAPVFWNVNQDNSPMSFPVATAEISITDGVNTYTKTYSEFDNIMTGVAFGTYNYTISTDCHADRTGSVTVGCATIDAMSGNVAVWEVQGDAQTMAPIFWNVNQDSSPMSFPVATAEISMTDGVNTYTKTYSEFDNIMTDVAFGTYDYTITTETCRVRAGSVTVGCGTIDAMSGNVAVWEVQGDASAPVFWNVNQDNSPMSFPVATAEISMTDGVNTYTKTYSEFDNIMTGVAFGTYNYTISTDCHADRTGSVTVGCATIDAMSGNVAVWEVQGDAQTMAPIFWNINQDSSPMSFPVATAEISMTDGVNTYTKTYSEFDNIMTDVAFGTYDYTITTETCRVRAGSVTVGCGTIDAMSGNVAVWEVQGDASAPVFWNVNQDNSPMSFPVATAEISITDGVNTYTKTYSEFDNIMTGVAFGTYNYTISTDCHADRTGSVTVGCATIDAMSGNVAVWEVQGDAQTMAPIFWNINQDNSPMSFPVATAEISMTDGVNTYTKTYSEFDNIMTDVAFGTYDYTITTETCRVRAGSVTVGCGTIDAMSGNVAVWEVQGDASAPVFWNVNQDNSPMSFPVATAEISMTDGVNTYTKTYSEFDNIMTGVAFGTYNYTISTDCHADRTGSVTVGCATIDAMSGNVAVWEVQGDAQTMAPIFWNINQDNSPMSFPVATAEISMTDGVNTYTKTYSEFDNIMTDVAFGTYDYTITTETCRVRAGSVTVGCGTIDAMSGNVAVWEVQGDASAPVFWNVNQDNSPMSFPVATAEISMTDGVNTYTKTYSEFDNIMTGVAFGTYNYTISTDCHADRTGSVTVGCATIDAMSGNVAVWEVQGDAIVIDDSVMQADHVLTANESGASYQWVDCNNGNAAIDGAINQTFTAATNGSYAVIITVGNCEATSVCYDVTTLSVDSFENTLNLEVYPNPVVNDVTIKLNRSYNNIGVQVYTTLGQLVRTIKASNETLFKVNMSDLALGVYILKINADGKASSSVLVKK